MPLQRKDLLNLTFEVVGQKQLDRALGFYANSVEDLRGVWPAIRDDFLKNEQKQFESEGRHGSGGWKPLSPVYAAWKAVHYPGKPILQRTGALFGSLTQQGDSNFIYAPGRKGLSIGTRVRYAGFHQRGTSNMPARPPIELQEAQKRRWVKLIHEFIINSKQGERVGLSRIFG